jgi:hypothetical protein
VDGATHATVEKLVMNRAHPCADVEEHGAFDVACRQGGAQLRDQQPGRLVGAAASKVAKLLSRLAVVELMLDSITLGA